MESHELPPSLPAAARLSLNRCNVPAVVLGGLTYQRSPMPLELDGVRPLHNELFRRLGAASSHEDRARCFVDYMAVRFRLERLEDAGFDPDVPRRKRINANYLRMVRGWSFDSAGREAAVLKLWVESRFGLVTQHHGRPLGGHESEARHAFLHEAALGVYATNAIEAQLDLLYAYCQYELLVQQPGQAHRTLYRGVNRFDEHEVLSCAGKQHYRVLLNNLNSFTSCRDRADEFGDHILEVSVPLPKIFFFNRLLPGMLNAEDEFVVIGGVYEVRISTR